MTGARMLSHPGADGYSRPVTTNRDLPLASDSTDPTEQLSGFLFWWYVVYDLMYPKSLIDRCLSTCWWRINNCRGSAE